MRRLVWSALIGLALAAACAAGETTTVEPFIVNGKTVGGTVTDVKVTGSIVEKSGAAQERVRHALPVEGVVLDDAGKPIAGAKVDVYLQDCDEPIATLSTDKDGKFAFKPMRGLPVMARRLVITAPGCTRIGVYCGDQQSRIPLTTLFKERPIKGRVVDENGKPLEGVTISLSEANGYRGNSEAHYGVGDPQFFDKLTTGKDGTFVLRGIADPEGFDSFSLGLHLSKPGRADLRRTLRKEDLSEPLDIVLPVGALITGKLLPPEGVVLSTRHFDVSASVTGSWGSDYKSTSAAKDGTFRLENVPPGEVTLRVRDYSVSGDGEREPLYVLPAYKFTLQPGETRGLELVLQRMAVVKGTVIDAATGAPVQKAVIRLRHSGVREDSWDTLSADEKGEFTFRAPAGEVELHVALIRRENGGGIQFSGDEDAPGASFTLAEGEQKTDLVVKVDMSEGREFGAPSQVKPIPPDLEIVPGMYQLTWDPELAHLQSNPWPFGTVEAKAKALITKLPAGLSDKAHFTLYQVEGKGNDGHLAVILDGDNLYVDANRNWDLSDDTPIKFEPPRQEPGREKRLGWISVQSHQGPLDGRHTNNPLGLKPIMYRTSAGLAVRFERRGGWKGVLDTNKGKVGFAIVDGDLNGNYNDRRVYDAEMHAKPPGDMLEIDFAGTGRINTASGARAFWFDPVNRIVRKYYALTASDVGDSLTVEPYTGPMGQLDVKIGSVQRLKGGSAGGAYLYTPSGMYDMHDEKPPFTVPAGKCRIQYGDAVLSSRTGAPLKIRYMTKTPVFVESGKTTMIEIAGRVSTMFDSNAVLIWQPGRSAMVDWLVGVGNGIGVEFVGEGMGRPNFTLLDSKGEVVANLRGGPVGWPEARYGVEAPKIKPGDYTLRMSLDTKSDLGTLVTTRQVTIAAPADTTKSDLYNRLSKAYQMALNSADPATIAKARREFLDTCFKEVVIKPGEEMRLDKPSQAVAKNYPGADKLSAAIKWVPEEAGLKVTADVVDASFSTDALDSREWNRSCVEIFVSATGLDDDIYHLFVVPEGPETTPRMRAVAANIGPVELNGVAGSWKRTAKGYSVTAVIPWSVLPRYEKDWAVMPVEAAVDTMTLAGQVQLRLCASPTPFRTTYGYAGLRAK